MDLPRAPGVVVGEGHEVGRVLGPAEAELDAPRAVDVRVVVLLEAVRRQDGRVGEDALVVLLELVERDLPGPVEVVVVVLPVVDVGHHADLAPEDRQERAVVAHEAHARDADVVGVGEEPAELLVAGVAVEAAVPDERAVVAVVAERLEDDGLRVAADDGRVRARRRGVVLVVARRLRVPEVEPRRELALVAAPEVPEPAAREHARAVREPQFDDAPGRVLEPLGPDVLRLVRDEAQDLDARPLGVVDALAHAGLVEHGHLLRERGQHGRPRERVDALLRRRRERGAAVQLQVRRQQRQLDVQRRGDRQVRRAPAQVLREAPPHGARRRRFRGRRLALWWHGF